MCIPDSTNGFGNGLGMQDDSMRRLGAMTASLAGCLEQPWSLLTGRGSILTTLGLGYQPEQWLEIRSCLI